MVTNVDSQLTVIHEGKVDLRRKIRIGTTNDAVAVPFEAFPKCGVQLVLETDSIQLFDDLRALLLGERRPAPVIDITGRFNQIPLTPELSVYDSLIPKEGNCP